MNKKILAGMVALAVASAASAEDVDVYGKFNLTLQNVDNGAESVQEVKSNSSRLGFKGTSETDSNFTVIYQVEFGVNPDQQPDKNSDGDKEVMSQRNSFLGIKGDFGTFKAGMFDTAMKSSQGKVDLFGDGDSDFANVVTYSDKRMENSVAYSTPSLGGATINVQYIASEAEGDDSGISTSVVFKQGDLYLAAAYDNGVVEDNSSTVRGTAVYKLGAVQLGALIESYEPAVGDSENGWLLSVKVPVNQWDLKAQYGASDIKQQGGTTFSVGADYNYTKQFKFVSYLTQNESDEGLDDTIVGAGGILKF